MGVVLKLEGLVVDMTLCALTSHNRELDLALEIPRAC